MFFLKARLSPFLPSDMIEGGLCPLGQSNTHAARRWPRPICDNASEIPARGWKDIALRVYDGIFDDRILANAAAVTFYALLGLFPAIAALVSIYGLVADPKTIASQLDSVSGILPGGAVDVVREQLTRLTAQGSATLGISFVVGLAISLWSANGGIKVLFDALNVSAR